MSAVDYRIAASTLMKCSGNSLRKYPWRNCRAEIVLELNQSSLLWNKLHHHVWFDGAIPTGKDTCAFFYFRITNSIHTHIREIFRAPSVSN